MAKHLIIGGDGLIGTSLRHWLLSRGETVVATTRRRDVVGPSRPFLDLGVLDMDCLGNERFDSLFLCAGHNPRQCDQDPEFSRKVNVLAPLQLAERVMSARGFVVKLSSNAVFDGSRPHQPADGPYGPHSLYGEQHRESDEALLKRGETLGIVRFSKVITPLVSVFDSWIENWANGKPVRPLTDLCMAPIALPFIIELVGRVGMTRRPGVFQASGDKDVSYAKAASLAAVHLGVPERLVRPATIKELGLSIGWQPRHTTLDMTETTQVFQMAPPTIEQAVEAMASSSWKGSSTVVSGLNAAKAGR